MYNKVKNKKLKVESRKSKVFKKMFLPFVFILLPFFVEAQCAMCRAALQGEEAQAQAEGINNGIVFLMIIPYVLVAAAGYAVYKIKYSKKNSE